MPEPRLSITVETDFPISIVRLTGQLGISTAPDVRHQLLKCLTDQPSAVIVDLGATELVDDVAALVFPAVARHASAWPGSTLLLCCAGPALRPALDQLAIARYVAVCSDRAEACWRAGQLPVPRRLREHLLPTAESAAVARHLVVDACRRWKIDASAEAAEIVITEMVTNAIRHAGTPLDLILSLRERYLVLAVRDGSLRLPERRFPDDVLAESGRGLMVLDAYTVSWGSVPAIEGKVVWATLRTQPRNRGG
jgi:anti-anti-sigma regulatory factor/anti-sigma regulatory factor (Ser/Thr protein kinase)